MVIRVPSQKIEISGLKSMDNELDVSLHVIYNAFYNNAPNIEKLLENHFEIARKYFKTLDKKNRISQSDDLFNNLSSIPIHYLATGAHFQAFKLWRIFIKETNKWKEEGIRLHLGTPYYFCGVSALLNNDFDLAMICFHKALIEDKRNSLDFKLTPSYYFLTLQESSDLQFLKHIIVQINKTIKNYLDANGGLQKGFKTTCYFKMRSKLNYLDFNKKFFLNDKINESIKYYVVHMILRLNNLNAMLINGINEEIISPLIIAQIINQFCLVIEVLIKDKVGGSKLGDSIPRLKIVNMETNLKKITQSRDLDFNNWIKSIKSQDSFAADFALLYGLRNDFAHNIKIQKELLNNFKFINQRLFNCLFNIIEKYY